MFIYFKINFHTFELSCKVVQCMRVTRSIMTCVDIDRVVAVILRIKVACQKLHIINRKIYIYILVKYDLYLIS